MNSFNFGFGDLIDNTNTHIIVRCNKVDEVEENKGFCIQCYWHNHPDRAKGKILQCKMY